MLTLQIEIFLLMAVGYGLSETGHFDRKTRSQVTDIVISVVLPCSIIRSFQIRMSQEVLLSTFLILLISFGIQILYYLFNLILYRNMDEARRICCKYGTMVSNAGFLGMPIAEGVFGAQGLLYASVFLIPQRIFMWSYGLSLFAGGKQGGVVKKLMTHPCIIAVLIGIVLMVMTSFDIALPSFLDRTIQALAQCNTALSMLVIGGILSDVDPKSMFDRDALFYSLIRLIVLPLVIMVILRLVHMAELPSNVCILLSAMPAASTTAMLAEKYDGDAAFASKLVFVSTLLSLVTLPLITMLFEMF
ncbi:MAG: AEC family transporter [Bulleidia sp.]